ncbi:MAG: hypothetical protein HKN79_06210, partial [Flavobacteriales bacterium]|nr:hypothetical protein [Flavobacteriales bacterium]
SSNSRTKEYTSVLDFIGSSIRERIDESDVLALDDVRTEDDYVQTTLRIGSFEISRGRRTR